MKREERKIVKAPPVHCCNCEADECKKCVGFDKFNYKKDIAMQYIKNNCRTMTDKELAEQLMIPRHKVYYIRHQLCQKGGSFKGCDDDCFNCPYPDCLKPYSLCTALEDTE